MKNESIQNRYIALIRSINVGGKSVMKMVDLLQTLKPMDFTKIKTYGQSGNLLIVTKETNIERLSRQLSERIDADQNLYVFIFTPEQLQDALEHAPFDPEGKDASYHCHLMFLSSNPVEDRVESLMDLQGTEYRFFIRKKVLYYSYPKSIAGHRRNINFEKVLGVRGTARTWNVIKKLIQLVN